MRDRVTLADGGDGGSRKRLLRLSGVAVATLALLMQSAASVASTALPMQSAPVPNLSAAQRERWILPVGGLDIVAPYQQPEHRYAAGHRGVDVAVAQGESVVAPVGATVRFSGRVVDRSLVSLQVDDNTVITIEPVESEVREGQRLAAGEVLGVVGSGGHCSDGCVHLGVRVDGEYVNPMRYFADRPVLLPLGAVEG